MTQDSLPRRMDKRFANIAVVLVSVGGIADCSQHRYRGTFQDPAECARIAAAMNDTHDTTQREICVSIEAAKSMGIRQ